MIYKNTKTGFVFETPCEVKAEGWENLSPKPITKAVKEEKDVKPVRTRRTKKDD